jgi:hypothetical protein
MHSNIITTTTSGPSSYLSSEEPRTTGDMDLSDAVRCIHRWDDRVT